MATVHQDDSILLVKGGFHRSALHKNTEPYANFVIAVVEACWNEADAGATRITVRFVRNADKTTDLWIYGNGVGISNQGLTSIVSVMDSPSASDPRKRGKIGTGSKAFCRHSDALTVQTLRQNESNLLEMHYTTEELVEILHASKQVRWVPKEIPAGSPLKGSGTLFIWHNMGHGASEYVNPRHPRTVGALQSEMANHLPRPVAKKITIIDEKGKNHELTARELVGKTLEGNAELPGIGAVAYEIAVTSQIDPFDKLQIWAFDAACTLTTFLTRVRKTQAVKPLLDVISRVLDNPQVIGQIAVPSWNEYILRGDMAGFRQGLFDDEDTIFIFLNWLYNALVPLISGILKEDENQVAQADVLRDKLVSQFQKLGGPSDEKTHIVDLDFLETQPQRVTLECNDSLIVEIPRPKPGEDYRWNDEGSPVCVTPRRGTRVTFTGGSTPGSGTVTLSLGSAKREVRVEVASRLNPELTYQVRNTTVGQQIRHSVVFTKHLRGVLAWSCEQGHGSLMDMAPDTLSITHQLPGTVGKYVARATGTLDDNTVLTLVATVLVTMPQTSRTRRNPSTSEFRFNGHTYSVLIRSYADNIVKASLIDEMDNSHTRLSLNTGHPKFSGSDSVCVRVAQLEIAQLIAVSEAQRNPPLIERERIPTHVMARSGELFATLMAKIND